jgi:hypothetical protein
VERLDGGVDFGQCDAAGFAGKAIDPADGRGVERRVIALEHQQQHLQRIRERDGAGKLACGSTEGSEIMLDKGTVQAGADDRARRRHRDERMFP